MNLILILFGKFVLWFSRTFNLGAGSTWPGHVAMETNPKFIKDILSKNSTPHPNPLPKGEGKRERGLQIILIAGTNGKTTTSLMLMKILEQAGLKVFRNEAGANLLNGIASTLIANSNIFGKLNYDAAIFEVDESNLPFALAEIAVVSSQLSVVLLNLFRDQLDRYGEVNTIAKKWDESLRKLPISSTIFTNGDDPKLADIANDSELVRYYFGVDESLMKKDKVGYDVDFTYCPNCNTKLKFTKVSYSHLGKFHCPNCGYTNHDTQTFPSLPHPLAGLYNIYNENAAVLVANQIFNVDKEAVHKALVDFKPAFGRQEAIKYKNREIIMLLSKNPAGFNQSIEVVAASKKKGNVLLLLNDRIPDGLDVSWIWDVDMENIPNSYEIFISGDRAYDMGLRIKYKSRIMNQESGFKIYENLNDAIETAISETSTTETLFILPTYSAMLEARKILTGRSIL